MINCRDDVPVFQDLHTVDLEEFKYGGTNITAFRLVDPERAEVQKVMRDWAYGDTRYGRKPDGAQSARVGLRDRFPDSVFFVMRWLAVFSLFLSWRVHAQISIRANI